MSTNPKCKFCHEVLIDEKDVEYGQHVDRSRCMKNLEYVKKWNDTSVDSLNTVLTLPLEDWFGDNGVDYVRCGRLTFTVKYMEWMGYVAEIDVVGTRGPNCTNKWTTLWELRGLRSRKQAHWRLMHILKWCIEAFETLNDEQLLEAINMLELGNTHLPVERYEDKHALEFFKWGKVAFTGKTYSEVFGTLRVTKCPVCGYHYFDFRNSKEGDPCPSAHDCGQVLVVTPVTSEDLEVIDVPV